LVIGSAISHYFTDDSPSIIVNFHTSLKEVQHNALMSGLPLAISNICSEKRDTGGYDKLKPLRENRQSIHPACRVRL